MAINFSYKHILTSGQSLPLIPLETRASGDYFAKIDISGNSVLSTLLVESCDVGATVNVSYYDFTTGGEIGEANLLKQHPEINAGLSTNRVLVGNTHDKAFIKASVVGGSARFSVYGTIVSTSATELADAIIQENQTVNFLTDKALGIGGYDAENGVWKFIRISEDGAIAVSSFTIFNNLLHAETTINQNIEQTVILKTYVTTTRLVKALFEGDGFGIISIFINGQLWAKKRNSWNDRTIEIDLGAYKMKGSDVLEVKVKNVNYFNNQANFNVFVYEG
jgi:hypothetical protein